VRSPGTVRFDLSAFCFGSQIANVMKSFIP
jgi:hypothetical protein